MGIVEELLQAYEPTEEDISKELTQEQLIKLCQRNRCRVDMWKWNVVEDFAQNFRDAGRLEGKSQKFIHKLLVKAYQRNKQLFQQTENEKDAERMEEWAYRKKNSLLQLDMWDYEEKMQSQVEDGMTASEEQEVLRQQYEKNTTTTSIDNPPLRETHTTLKITIVGREERMSIDVGTEQDAYAVATVPLYPPSQEPTIRPSPRKQNPQKQQNASEEDASIVREVMEINSESMTIDTQNLTDCIDELPEQSSSEECVALNLSALQETPVQPIIATQSETYDDFHERMPLTSTQDAVC